MQSLFSSSRDYIQITTVTSDMKGKPHRDWQKGQKGQVAQPQCRLNIGIESDVIILNFSQSYNQTIIISKGFLAQQTNT